MTAFISRAYGSKEWEVIIKTDNEDHYKYAELFARKLIDHGKTHHMTNADRIRAMSDEELARLMADKCLDGEIEKLTKIGLTPTYSEKEIVRHKLFMQWFDWLRQPVKDGDNDGKSNDPE